jgi:hypothetical protein
LSSGLAPGFLALRINAFTGGWSVRGWRFRRIGRVFLSSCQLVFKIVDFLIAVRELFFEILKKVGLFLKLCDSLSVLVRLFSKILVLLAQAIDLTPESFK